MMHHFIGHTTARHQGFNRHDGIDITLTDESASCLSHVESVSLWEVAATMSKRGRKQQVDSLGPTSNPGAATAAGDKKKAMKYAKVLKAQKPQETIDITTVTEEDFRRNASGRNYVREYMKYLYRLDCQKFGDRPCFDSEGQCLINRENARTLSWHRMCQASPQVVESLQLVWIQLSLLLSFAYFGLLWHTLAVL